MKNLHKSILKSKMEREAKHAPKNELSYLFYHKNDRHKNRYKADKMASLFNSYLIKQKRVTS